MEIVGLLHHLGLRPMSARPDSTSASLRGNLGVCEYLLVDAVTTTKTRLDPIDKNQACRPSGRKGRQIVQFLNERPVCERGVKAFVQDNMSLGACIRICIAGEKARFPSVCSRCYQRIFSRGDGVGPSSTPSPRLSGTMFLQCTILQQAPSVVHLFFSS